MCNARSTHHKKRLKVICGLQAPEQELLICIGTNPVLEKETAELFEPFSTLQRLMGNGGLIPQTLITRWRIQMTKFNNTTVTRKIALMLGALVVSSMTLAGAVEAKSKIHIDLNFGTNGFSGISFGNGYIGNGFVGNGWNYCDKYWFNFQTTGKFKYKNKYMKCMGYW
jgi:hypothetical protein